MKFGLSASEYDRIRDRAADVFNLDNSGLPNQIFKGGFTNFKFIEFELISLPEFWDVLVSCADQSNDSDFFLVIQEPDPETYYFSRFGRYGAFIFNRNNSVKYYLDALQAEPENSPADTLLHNGRVISFFSSSKEWAFWGELALGIGIAASRNPKTIWPSVGRIHWYNVDEALSDFVAPNFKDGNIPKRFIEQMRKNFTGEKNI